MFHLAIEVILTEPYIKCMDKLHKKSNSILIKTKNEV